MSKKYQVNKAFKDAASQRAKRQVNKHISRLNEDGQVRANMINPKYSEKPRLSDNDGAVWDIKKRFRGRD